MAYDVEQFRQEGYQFWYEWVVSDPKLLERFLDRVSVEMLLEGLTVDQILAALSPERREQLKQRLLAEAKP